MKDFIGQELQIGDRVIYTQLKYRSLGIGTITRITQHYAFLIDESNYDREIKQSPTQLIKHP